MPHIFLYGPSGVGKSTIGKVLARNLILPFVDSDRVIEVNAGLSIPEIVEGQGETRLRDVEAEALEQIIQDSESVVALGGGALLREENRTLVETSGSVFLLMAELPNLLERLQNDSHKRPLLAGDLKLKLTSYLESRAEHYDSFPLKVHVDEKSIEQTAHQIQVMLGRHHLSAMGEYDVLIQNGGINHLGEMLKARALGKPILVTDDNVAGFYAEGVMTSLRDAGFTPGVIVIPSGEAHKNLETIRKLWQEFLGAGLDRKSTVVALGGGVIGDLAGFAASTFMRGIHWVCVPTTLLAMVDASLGGKTGFDLPEGKNLIGSFYPPKLVLADPRFLHTLPEAELIAGLAEVVKHGIISDPELFQLCRRGLEWVKGNLEEIVKRAVAVKVKVIEEDPYEKGFRAALNLGHTVGHAVELVSGFRLRHGEAVSIGMVAEAKLAERLTVASSGLTESIRAPLSELGLPVQIPKDLPRQDLIRAMKVDKKKSNGVVRFALPVEIGKIEFVEVRDLELALEE
ncbi:MAG TPA: 3-dehydroquinate synthase [Anaerolineales bacterium]|nr:3-dehydroquinate synthase [Anaerolineales bacterium]